MQSVFDLGFAARAAAALRSKMAGKQSFVAVPAQRVAAECLKKLCMYSYIPCRLRIAEQFEIATPSKEIPEIRGVVQILRIPT
jgi:hypothetical protein